MAMKPLAKNDRPGYSGNPGRGYSNLPPKGVGITAPPGINHGDPMIAPQVAATIGKTDPKPGSTSALPADVMADRTGTAPPDPARSGGAHSCRPCRFQQRPSGGRLSFAPWRRWLRPVVKVSPHRRIFIPAFGCRYPWAPTSRKGAARQ